MKLFSKVKDGGPYSKVTAYFLIELKGLFSIGLLRFDRGSREAFHTHAFDCISWVLRGHLLETLFRGGQKEYRPSWRPVLTRRRTFHQVFGLAPCTWVLTSRGPWVKTWREYLTDSGNFQTLSYGRRVVSTDAGRE